MPTSITTAPGLTQSAVTCSGRPIATISRSACRATAAASRVRGVADGDGRVAPLPLLKQQKRHRLAHDLRPAQDDRMGPPGLDAGVDQQLADAQRRARHEPRRPGRQQAEVERVKAVDVLERRNPLDDGRLVDLLRQRQLHQDAMNRRIGVQPVDRGQELGLASSRPAAAGPSRSSRPPCTPSPCCGRRPGWPDRRRPGRRSSPGTTPVCAVRARRPPPPPAGGPAGPGLVHRESRRARKVSAMSRSSGFRVSIRR